MFVMIISSWETKDRFKKFMESVLSKSGKMRSLVKELKTKYAHDEGANKFVSQSVAFSCILSSIIVHHPFPTSFIPLNQLA